MRLSVNKSACAGHALCNAVAEELFPLDDDGYFALEPREVAAADEQRARDGVASCPESALTLETE